MLITRQQSRVITNEVSDEWYQLAVTASRSDCQIDCYSLSSGLRAGGWGQVLVTLAGHGVSDINGSEV